MKLRMGSRLKPESAGTLPVKWILLGLVSQTAWGGYPVLARYIQTVGRVPPLIMTGMANGIATAVLLIFVVPRMRHFLPKPRDLAIFGSVVVLRSLSNVFAVRFTGAINVQLVSLMTPFIVALLSMPLLGEKLPRFTIPAVFLSVAGSILLITSDAGKGTAFNLSRNDILGLCLAFVSALLLAIYMITIRRVVRSETSAETLGTFQALVLFLFMTMGSLVVREDWGALARLPARGWMAIAAFGLGVILAGTLIQNSVLKHIRASFYTVMLAWRLVSTTILAALILGERLTSLWQGLGALIVMSTVTFYSWSQGRPGAPPVE